MDDEHASPTYVGPATWTVVRERYLHGVPATSLARHFGLKADTIWKRAKREGWSRRDRARRAPGHEDPPLFLQPVTVPLTWDEPFLHPADMSQAALTASDRAMRAGRFDEAIKLARLAEVALRMKKNT